MRFCLKFLLLCVLWSAGLAGFAYGEQVNHGAVILQYHRFGEQQYPSTNIRMQQFKTHIRYLQDNGFQVWPLPKIIDTLEQGRNFPEKVVGLSVDDAFLSVYEQAWPLLKQANFPVTLFVVPASHAGNNKAYMNWQQLNEVVASGLVTIGSQTVNHHHLPLLSEAEIESELRKSAQLIETHIGIPATLLAYPYGEASLLTMQLAEKIGYRAAFGQHSGAIGKTSQRFYLPRFAINEKYGDIDKLINKINSLPLPITNFTPANPVIDELLREFRFSLPKPMPQLACYYSHMNGVLETLDNQHFTYRLTEVPPLGRSRINCTAQAKNKRWMWFGKQFIRYR